ncbi:hypothetical protein [Thomasclavelia sp.]|uniref:hypothetical protein n=1 Tax=Thomasclavelia sp. TaxID=3025757 RepID=UPI0025FED9CE|nr:hypothetical protein [Thomasclavelia sp.]
MDNKAKEQLMTITKNIKSITEILFAIQLLDDGYEQLKIDMILELPINTLEQIITDIEQLCK